MAKKLANVIEAIMARAADFRGGEKVFDVANELGKDVEPIRFYGAALIQKSAEEILSEYEGLDMDDELCKTRDARLAEAETRAKRRSITFKTTTKGKDRHGTRVNTAGIGLENYRSNPVFVWGHDAYGGMFRTPDMEHVIGRSVEERKGSMSMEQDIEFATFDVNPKGDRAFRMVQARMLQATSIGFIPQQVVVNLEEDRDVPEITKSELLETSLVTVPSNPEVEAFVRSMSQSMGLKLDFNEEQDPKSLRDILMPEIMEALQANMRGWRDNLAKVLSIPAPVMEQALTPPAVAEDSGVANASKEAVRLAVSSWMVRAAIRRAL